VNYSQRPPSTRWAALTFKGEILAEVWFKPEEEPSGLVFRIPRDSFQRPGVGHRLSAESLLKAVAVPTDQVESWDHGDASGSSPSLTDPLPEPPPDAAHLEVHVLLKPPPQAVAPEATADSLLAPGEWQELEALWKAVLVIEAAVEAARKSVEGVRMEVETAARRTLTAEEKVHALAGDIAQWNQAKSRAHYALPKASDFIHRATWAATAAERKKLGEIFEAPEGARPPHPPADQLVRELENLRKSRQVLSAQGTTVYQECRAISADVQGALRRLQSNAAARAAKKKGGAGGKGKSF